MRISDWSSDVCSSDLDVAVLDIKMPRMDGMELLSRLRQTCSMPVIFLTSKDDEVDELLGLRMGADDYITKPFSKRMLIERIRTLIRRAQLSATHVVADHHAVLTTGERTVGPHPHPIL